MKMGAESLASGGNQVSTPGKRVGGIDWIPISKALNRSTAQCSSIYNDELKRQKEMNAISGSFSTEEVCMVVIYEYYHDYVI